MNGDIEQIDPPLYDNILHNQPANNPAANMNGEHGLHHPPQNNIRRQIPVLRPDNNDYVPQNANGTLLARHATNAIPICDGSPVSVSKFTRSLRHISMNLRPNEEQNLLILLGGRLAGVALDHYYRNLPEYNSIEDLIADFKFRFGDNINIATLLGNIRGEQMVQGDTVSHFADKIESAVSRAKCQIDNNADLGPEEIDTLKDLVDSTALEHFLDSLLPDLEVRTKIMRPATLPSAITIAIEVESKIRKSKSDFTNLIKRTKNINLNTQSNHCVIHGNCNHTTDQCRELSKMSSQRNSRPSNQNPELNRTYGGNYTGNNYNDRYENRRPNNGYRPERNYNNQNYRRDTPNTGGFTQNRYSDRDQRPNNNFTPRNNYSQNPQGFRPDNRNNYNNFAQNGRNNYNSYDYNRGGYNNPPNNSNRGNHNPHQGRYNYGANPPQNNYSRPTYENANRPQNEYRQPQCGQQGQPSMLNPPYMQEARALQNQGQMHLTHAFPAGNSNQTIPKNGEAARTTGPTTQMMCHM